MAPKGNKRATSAAASPKKRSRLNPVFAGIISTLQGADDLSENCREMLIAMASPCLSTLKSERHSVQLLGVTMIEEKLQDHKKKLIEAVAAAQTQLTELEASKGTLLQTLEEAKAAFEEKKTAFLAVHTAREEAKESVKVAEKALAEAKDTQKKGDANYTQLEKSRAAIEAAYKDHFKAPMEANEGPHHSNLKPFIQTLGLEDSLTSALPSSCTKPKDQRGSFDEVVITELGKAMEGKIASLTKSAEEELAGVDERKSAVTAAEAVLESKIQIEKKAAEELEAASTAQHEAEAAVSKASEEWTTFEPRVQEATDKHAMEDTIRMDFEEGALKNFMNLRDKDIEVPAPVEEEAATAGA
jgi:chromosome segregation ATPase